MKRLDREFSNVILKIDDWKLERLQSKLHLINGETVTNDLFEMLRLAKVHSKLNCEDFWNVRVFKEDRIESNPINLIYHLSGGDRMWNGGSVWNIEWKDCCGQFLEWFEPKIRKIVKGAKTLGDLKNKIESEIGTEDLYEFGLRYGLILLD